MGAPQNCVPVSGGFSEQVNNSNQCSKEQKTWDPSEGRDDLHNVNSTVPALCPPSASTSAWLICRIDDLENMFKKERSMQSPMLKIGLGKNDTDLNLPGSPGIDACSGSGSELQDGSHNKRCLRGVRRNHQLHAWNYSPFFVYLTISYPQSWSDIVDAIFHHAQKMMHMLDTLLRCLRHSSNNTFWSWCVRL